MDIRFFKDCAIDLVRRLGVKRGDLTSDYGATRITSFFTGAGCGGLMGLGRGAALGANKALPDFVDTLMSSTLCGALGFGLTAWVLHGAYYFAMEDCPARRRELRTRRAAALSREPDVK